MMQGFSLNTLLWFLLSIFCDQIRLDAFSCLVMSRFKQNSQTSCYFSLRKIVSQEVLLVTSTFRRCITHLHYLLAKGSIFHPLPSLHLITQNVYSV